jgi:hypothetical protein
LRATIGGANLKSVPVASTFSAMTSSLPLRAAGATGILLMCVGMAGILLRSAPDPERDGATTLATDSAPARQFQPQAARPTVPADAGEQDSTEDRTGGAQVPRLTGDRAGSAASADVVSVDLTPPGFDGPHAYTVLPSREETKPASDATELSTVSRLTPPGFHVTASD